MLSVRDYAQISEGSTGRGKAWRKSFWVWWCAKDHTGGNYILT